MQDWLARKHAIVQIAATKRAAKSEQRIETRRIQRTNQVVIDWKPNSVVLMI